MLQLISPIEAMLWDMDGTVSDTEPLHFLACQQSLSAYGVTFTEDDYRQFLGATDRALCEAVVNTFRLPVAWDVLLADKEARLVALIKQHAVLRPGVLRMLETARRFNVKLAVASSSTLATIELVLTTLGIKDYFQAVASGEEVERSKPAPDVFLLAAKRLGIKDPTRCLVVEDSIHGIHAAKAARMYCLAVACESTRYQDHSPADIVLASHDQVLVTENGFQAGTCSIQFI